MSTKDKIASLLEGMNTEVFMDVFNDVLIGQEELLKEYFIAAFENRGVNDKQYRDDAYLLTGAILSNVNDYFEKYYAEELSDDKGDKDDSAQGYATKQADEINGYLKVGYAS